MMRVVTKETLYGGSIEVNKVYSGKEIKHYNSWQLKRLWLETDTLDRHQWMLLGTWTIKMHETRNNLLHSHIKTGWHVS